MAELCKLCVESQSVDISGSEDNFSSSDVETVSETNLENVSEEERFSDSGEEESTEGRKHRDYVPAMPTSGADGNHGRRSRRSRHHRIASSSVVMPSGQTYTITMPVMKRKWKCGDKPDLIPLNPTGKMGKVEYDIVVKEMESTRKAHISGKFSGYDVIKVEKISNTCLWKKYRFCRRSIKLENNGDANERMLWHGSNAMQEIIQGGFDERHASQTGMFGAGLYFAENSSKSNQYAYGLNGRGCKLHTKRHCFVCERQLLLCRVALGKVMEYTSAQQQLTFAPPGYHSVKGVVTPGVLVYSENIVFRGEQVYPEYLITYKLKP